MPQRPPRALAYPLIAELQKRAPFSPNGHAPEVHRLVQGLEHLVAGDSDRAHRIIMSVLDQPGNHTVWNQGDSGGQAKSVVSPAPHLMQGLQEVMGRGFFVKTYAPHVVTGCVNLSSRVYADDGPAPIEWSAPLTENGVPVRLISLDAGPTLAASLGKTFAAMSTAARGETALEYMRKIADHTAVLDAYVDDPDLRPYFAQARPEAYDEKFLASMQNTSRLVGVDIPLATIVTDARALNEDLSTDYRAMFDPWSLNYTLAPGGKLTSVDVEKAFSKLANRDHRLAHLYFDPSWPQDAGTRFQLMREAGASEGGPDRAYPALYFWLSRQLGIRNPEHTERVLGSETLSGAWLRHHLRDFSWLLSQPEVQRTYRTAPLLAERVAEKAAAYDVRP